VPRLLALPAPTTVSTAGPGAPDGSGTRLLLAWVDPGQGIRLASLSAGELPAP
jgi:hypothetical protein